MQQLGGTFLVGSSSLIQKNRSIPQQLSLYDFGPKLLYLCSVIGLPF
jgi:hypothetical protein